MQATLLFGAVRWSVAPGFHFVAVKWTCEWTAVARSLSFEAVAVSQEG